MIRRSTVLWKTSDDSQVYLAMAHTVSYTMFFE